MTGVFATRQARRGSLIRSRRVVASRRHAREVREDLDAAILVGGSAAELAERFGVTPETVVRHRTRLRGEGHVVPVLIGGELVPTRGGGSPMKNCERCADRPAEEEIGGWSVCSWCAPRERAKHEKPPPALPTGPVEPLAPADRFRCEFYRCDLTARACVDRQVAVFKPGGDAEWMKRPKYAHCGSGACAQGALIKLRLGSPPKTPTRRDYLTREQRDQRAAAELAAIEQRLAVPARCSVVDCEQPMTSKARDGLCGRHVAAAARRTPQEETMQSPFLRRVIEQRDTEQGLRTETDFEAADEKRSAELEPLTKKRCVLCNVILVDETKWNTCSKHSKAERRAALFAATSPAAPPPPPPGRPAAPAEEKQMPRKSKISEATDDQVRVAWEKFGTVNGVQDHFGGSFGATKDRLKALGLLGAAPAAPKPRRAPKLTPVPPPEPTPAAEPVHFRELPDPSLLPPAYLLRCVVFARSMQADLAAALDGRTATANDIRSIG